MNAWGRRPAERLLAPPGPLLDIKWSGKKIMGEKYKITYWRLRHHCAHYSFLRERSRLFSSSIMEKYVLWDEVIKGFKCEKKKFVISHTKLQWPLYYDFSIKYIYWGFLYNFWIICWPLEISFSSQAMISNNL